jgi:hypothetical protein
MTESSTPRMHERGPGYPVRQPPGPGPLARLIAFIVSVGLAWAITIAVLAWLIGLVFARG